MHELLSLIRVSFVIQVQVITIFTLKQPVCVVLLQIIGLILVYLVGIIQNRKQVLIFLVASPEINIGMTLFIPPELLPSFFLISHILPGNIKDTTALRNHLKMVPGQRRVSVHVPTVAEENTYMTFLQKNRRIWGTMVDVVASSWMVLIWTWYLFLYVVDMNGNQSRPSLHSSMECSI